MPSPHEQCTQHSGIMGRLNLLITLMSLALAGILALYGNSNSNYAELRTRLGELDKSVAVTTEKTQRIEDAQKAISTRLDRLEARP